MRAGAASARWFALQVRAAESQNPSQMVEHTRENPRFQEEHLAGKREKLDAETLFMPKVVIGRKEASLLVLMHGGDWSPEVAAAKHGMAGLDW